MPEASQYLLNSRELLEVLIKQTGVSEGQWMLVANFGFTPGNFGPTTDQAAPGVVCTLQKIGIQLADPSTAAELTMDASTINPKKKS